MTPASTRSSARKASNEDAPAAQQNALDGAPSLQPVRVTRAGTRSQSPTKADQPSSRTRSKSATKKPQPSAPSGTTSAGSKKGPGRGKGKPKPIQTPRKGRTESAEQADDELSPEKAAPLIEMSGALLPSIVEEEGAERAINAKERRPSMADPPQPMPRSSSLSNKRKSSDDSESSNKRVRFMQSEPPEEMAKMSRADQKKYFSTKPRVIPEELFTASSRAGTESPPLHVKDSQLRYIWSAMRKIHQVQNVADVSVAFGSVQTTASNVGVHFFGPREEHSGEAEFNLAELQTTYPQQFRIMRNILDASTTNDGLHGWDKMITQPHLRQWVVYGILGEMLKQRVFKDTEFGLPADYSHWIHARVDVKDVNYDAYDRGLTRANVLKECLKNGDNLKSMAISLQAAAEPLCDEICLAWAGIHLAAADSGDEIPHLDVWHAVFQVIIDCAILNWSLVLLVSKGIMVRMAERAENGYVVPTNGPFSILNNGDLNQATLADQNVAQDAHKVVKMTCWSRVEAVVAYGKSYKQLANLQKQAIAEHASARLRSARGTTPDPDDTPEEDWENFCWDCAFKGQDSVRQALPNLLQQTALEQHHKRCMRLRSARDMAREQNEDGTAGEGDGGQISVDGEFPPPPRDENGKITGAYVKIYTNLVPHQVYCEWTKSEAYYRAILEDAGLEVNDHSVRSMNSLANAVRRAETGRIPDEARITFTTPVTPHLRNIIENIRPNLWNTYARHNLKIEYGGAVLAGIMFGLYRERIYDSVGPFTGAVLNVFDTAGTKLLEVGQLCNSAVFKIIKESYGYLKHWTPPRVDDLEIFAVQIAQRLRNLPRDVFEKILELLPKLDTAGLEHQAIDLRDHVSYVSENVATKVKSSWPDIVDMAKQDATTVSNAVKTVMSTGSSALSATPSALSTSSSITVGSIASAATNGFHPLSWLRNLGADHDSIQTLQDTTVTPSSSFGPTITMPGSFSSTRTPGILRKAPQSVRSIAVIGNSQAKQGLSSARSQFKASASSMKSKAKASGKPRPIVKPPKLFTPSARGENVIEPTSRSSSAVTKTKTVSRPVKTVTEMKTSTATVTRRGERATVTKTMTMANGAVGPGWKKDLHRVTLMGDQPSTVVVARGQKRE